MATVNGVASNGVLLTIVSNTLPGVAQVQPADGTSGVPINGRVIVRFAQAVQAATIVPGTLTVSQGPTSLTGTVTLSNDGLSLTFAASQSLAASTTFSVAVTNVAGNQTTPEFQSTFTTGTSSDTVSPQVVQTSPQSNSTGVPTSAPFQVQFTKPMDPATLTPQNFTLRDNTTGNTLPGLIQVDASGLTASFVPQSLLPVGRSLSAQLSSNIDDSSGNGLAGSTYFTFTTAFAPDSTAPQITGVSPANGASSVPTNALIVLQFSKPLDVISVGNGLQFLSSGQPVAGAVALSNGNQLITFTPTGGLTPNTTYSVVVTSQITDVGGLALSNPATYSLTSGATSDSTTPSVVSVSPANNSAGAPINGIVQVHFSKPVDPLTVTASTFQLLTGSITLGGTISVSADGLTATFSPTSGLSSYTNYVVLATYGITDVEGHTLAYYESFFTTGSTSDSSSPTVQTISPANGATGVPVNVRVDVVANVALSTASVGSGAVVVSNGGISVPGTVTPSSDGTTLTYLPSTLLNASKTYTVTVSGVTDEAGNTLVPFTSSFTTGTSGTANTTQPAVVSMNPANGASSVSVNSTIVLTFNEAIDFTTANAANVQISANGFGGQLAGSFSIDSTGTVLTFTPVSPLPGNTTITVYMPNGVLDLSGNHNTYFYSTFTTGTGTDTTSPTVVMVTPQNAAIGVNLNTQVVLTFSKSLNSSTVNTNNFALLVNGVAPVNGLSISTSADNRVVTLNAFGLAASSTVTVLVTSGVTDLSGNPAVAFESQFTTGSAASTSAPYIATQRPGSGATGVPQNTSVVLYFSQPMNAASVTGAVHVSQNGNLASGTLQVTDNGQVVQFTPSAPWPSSAYVQVFVDSTAQNASGVNMNAYQSSFTVVANTSTTPPSATGTNPSGSASSVPTNVAMDIAFNVPLDPTTLTPTSVLCYQNGAWIQSEVSLVSGGTLLQIVPRLALQTNTSVNCSVSTSMLGTNGIASYGANLQFTTGSGPDTVVPTITSLSPPNASTNVGDNASIRLKFSKPINPLTINANTVQLSGGGTTVVPDSISFSNNNQTVLLVPHAPLPDSTQMTLTISGITDVAGNVVAPQTTQFTTATGPDFVPPLVVWTSPLQTNPYVLPTAPTNTIIQVEANKPVDPGTVNGSTLLIYDPGNNSVPGTYSVSADGRTITFVPSAPFTAGQQYTVYALNGAITDLAGNGLSSAVSPVMGNFHFTAGSTANTNAPQVTGISPANGAPNVPINAQVTVAFNEPIDPATLGGLNLAGPGGAVTTSSTVTNGDQFVGLIPVVPLAPATQYTVTAAGVQDLAGNLLAPPFTSTFTTGSSADLAQPKVASTSPSSNASGVSTSSAIQVQFSKPIDPLTVQSTTFLVYPATNIPVPGTISVSANGMTVTLTPSEPLDSVSPYTIELTTGISDVEGHNLSDSRYYFTTAQGTTSLPPNVLSLYPSAANYVGSAVTINGTYFGTTQGSSTVTFNGVPATVNSWNDVQISATVPSGATTGPVVVTVNGVASNSVPFTVYIPPVISSISPTAATLGSQITITGTNFGDAQDTVEVQFNASVYPAPAATIVSRSETTITVVIPPSSVTGNLQVSVNGIGDSTAFTVIPTPAISQLLPNSGVGGTSVAIYGTNFGTSQGSSTLSFNGVPAASISTWSNNYIAAIAASNVTTGPVTIVVNSISSDNSAVFTVTNPAIGSLSPPSGAVGSTITVSGSGLTAQGLTTQIFFNGIAGYVSSLSTSNSLSVQVPANATTGPVTVDVGTVASNSVSFTVEQPPVITAVSPNSGPFANGVLTPVTIEGSGFGATQSNSTVNFWLSQTAPSIVSWSDTSIVTWVPNDAGTGPLTVTVGQITATAPSWFYANRQTVLTDSLGNQTAYSFQAQGGHWFTTASAGPGCVTCTVRGNITNVGDSNGNILTTTDDLSNTTTFTYDPANDMTSASKPLNTSTTATTSYTYNSLGEVLTMTDPLGNTTTNTYDANGNMLTVTAPQPDSNTPASVTQFAYDSKGELTQVTDPLQNVTKLTYNSVGLIASITDAQNKVTSYQYDARGNRTAVIDPINGAAHPTSFAYDIMNRLTGITYPDGSTVSFTYDVRGRRISATDQNNKTTTYTYDDDDRMTSVTDPAHNTTQYAYDTEDNLLSITDANNHITQFAYNARGWVTQTTFPSTLLESYTYDLVGHMLTKTDRKNQTIQYVYDALYRLSSKTYPDSTSVEYAYDLAGKVQQVSDPTGVYGFSYDNMGRMIGTSTQYSYLPGFNFQNTYTYDAASNRKSLTAPDGSISTYGYDTLNRLNGLANSWAGSFGFSYDGLSRRTQLTRPNGITTNYSYDAVSHLLSVLHQVGMNTLDGASYTYDPAGNRISRGNYLNGVASNYSYDPLYELTQVTQGGNTTETYSYDAVGNRLSSSGVSTYNYNSSNELTSNSNGSYTYDANGNTLTDASGRTFTWDFQNRLAQVVATGTGTTTFKYDPFGRRIQKSGTLGTTNYLYDGPETIEEIDNGGNGLARYMQGPRIDQPLAELRSGTSSYYEQDWIGAVTSLSNSAGALTNTYTYDSFGKLTASTGTLTNPFQYTAREFDPETGIYEYRMRYYDPGVGRFLSEDPIQFGGGEDFYAYTHNNPVRYFDPSGLGWRDWPIWDHVPGVHWMNCKIWAYYCAKAVQEKKLEYLAHPETSYSYTNDELEHPDPSDEHRVYKKCVANDENCKKWLDECGDTALDPLGDGMFPK
jgi:RHS repeat-associated protein